MISWIFQNTYIKDLTDKNNTRNTKAVKFMINTRNFFEIVNSHQEIQLHELIIRHTSIVMFKAKPLKAIFATLDFVTKL